jgi:hypothetical protein
MDTYGWMHSTLGEPTFDLQNAPKPLAAGASPGPHWGSLQRSPRPPSWISGAPLRGEGEGRGGEGREGEGKGGKGREGKGRGIWPPPIGTAGSATGSCS